MALRLIISICLFLSAITLSALEDFVVKDIKITGNNKNASIARNTAIEQGQIHAFSKLIKLYYPTILEESRNFTNDEILGTVEGFELSGEKRSTTNYIAKMNVRFDRASVDNLLGAASFKKRNDQLAEINHENHKYPVEQFPETISTPTMVTLLVPVYRKNNYSIWFEDENIWLNFLYKKLEKISGTKFLLPLGDLEDIALLNKNLLSKNLLSLSSIFERYNINNVALVELDESEQNSLHKAELKINYINKFHRNWQQYIFPAMESPDLNLLMQTAFSELDKFKFNASEHETNLPQLSSDSQPFEKQTIFINFTIEKLEDWIELEKKLLKISRVSNIDLQQVSLKNYRFALGLTLSIDDLKEALLTNGFVLENALEQNHFNLFRN